MNYKKEILRAEKQFSACKATHDANIRSMELELAALKERLDSKNIPKHVTQGQLAQTFLDLEHQIEVYNKFDTKLIDAQYEVVTLQLEALLAGRNPDGSSPRIEKVNSAIDRIAIPFMCFAVIINLLALFLHLFT